MLSIILRTAVMYLAVTVSIRLMGKRQIGDMQPNELVITLLISEIAAIPLQDINQPILSGISAIAVLVILEIIVSVLAMKSFFIRKLTNGKSVVIIKNGVIDQQSMKDVRMTVLDLIELLRRQDVFDISDVAFAVLEVNGDLSVMLKPEKQTVTAGDMSIQTKNQGLPLPVISDGKIIKESLSALEINREQLYTKISTNGLKGEDIFLMTMDRYENFSIIKKKGK